MVAASAARIAGLAHFLRDFEFDRQAVTVPARNVRRAVAAQRFVLDDDVFENLVQRGADVDVAVGERRAIVQHEFLGAGALLESFRRDCASHFSSRCGSRVTRSAFIGKSVRGRFNVFL